MDYSKVTMLEYQAKKKAILDSLGRIGGICNNVSCVDCPLRYKEMTCTENEFKNPLSVVKLVMDYEIPVDWSKVKKDTLIWVKDSLSGKEIARYFAKYENGTIYAFGNGCTSFTTSDIVDWKYARLAESEE